MKKKCNLCNKEFNCRSNSHKVCDKCKDKKCVHCGKQIKGLVYLERLLTAKYCSRGCYISDRWKERRTGKCKHCGKKTESVYCSKQCQLKYWNSSEEAVKKKNIQQWKRKIKILKSLGGKCKKCGTNDIRILDIDHIEMKDKKLKYQKTYSLTLRLKDWEENMDNLQILCANCHRIKTWNDRGFGKNINLKELW